MVAQEFPLTYEQAAQRWDLTAEQWRELEALGADGWCIRLDRSRNGDAYRCRIHRHSGHTFVDFRCASTSRTSMSEAIKGAVHQLRKAGIEGRVHRRGVDADQCRQVGIWEVR